MTLEVICSNPNAFKRRMEPHGCVFFWMLLKERQKERKTQTTNNNKE